MRMIRLFPWRWLAGWWWAAGSLTAALAAGPPAASAGDAIKMSPYEVIANSLEFRSWIKVSSPHYIVYTDASFIEACGVLRELEMVHAAAQAFLRRRTLNLPPMILVLPTSGSDWRKLASKGKVQWKAAVSSPASEVMNMILAEHDWQNEGLWMVRAGQGRALFAAMNIDGPFWFRRGVGKFFETAEISRDAVTLGRQNSRTRHLRISGWLKWPKFFGLTSTSPEFTRETDERHQVEGQCALFVQYFLSNVDESQVDRLMQWVALLNANHEPTETEFIGVFGQDWKAWQKTMEAYMAGGRYQVLTIPVPPTATSFPTKKVDPPVREMRELFILCQILNQHIPASETSLDALIAKGLKTESLEEMLLEACLYWRRTDNALERARKLAEAGSANPLVHLIAAVGSARPDIAGEDLLKTRFDAEKAEQLRHGCRRALEIEPLHEMANDLLATVEALGPQVTEENVAAIHAIYRRLSGHVSTCPVVTALAIAQWRVGNAGAARETANLLLGSPYADKEARATATALLKELSGGS